MLGRMCLCAESRNVGEGCRVTKLNMAGSDDSAECQHVQRGSFLLCALFAQLHGMDLRG